MATLTLRRAAVTYSRGPKGMKAWQLLSTEYGLNAKETGCLIAKKKLLIAKNKLLNANKIKGRTNTLQSLCDSP